MVVDVDALIKKARQEFDSSEPVEQDVVLGDRRVTVRARVLDPQAWLDLTAKFPPREDAVRDKRMGYNLYAAVREYPGISLVVDGEEQPLGERWPDVWDVLSAPDKNNVAILVWGKNELEPSQRVVGKVSPGGRARKRRSPGNSA